MSERYAIFKRRKAGEKWPWTTDPILRDAKFCNVFRESDRTSIWIAQNWRDPRRDDPDNWLPMALARFGPFETSALEAIGYPVSWNPGHVRAVLTERLQRKQPTFSSAYKGIMAEPGQSRVDSVIQVLDQMWCDREQLRPRPGDTCLSFCERLQSYPGVGGFLSAQVVADQKHIGSLYDATDWWWFAKPGPGSERGLHRVRKSTLIDSKWTEATWHRDLLKLQAQIALLLVAAGLPRLDAQNQQNCLCEFDKWERYRETGKIPRKYKPAGTEPTIAKTEKALKAEIGAAETKLDESKAEPEPATKTKPAPATTTTDDIPDYILADGEQRPVESKPEAPPPPQAKAETPKQPPPPPRNDGNGATDKRTSYPHGERDTGKRLEFYIYRDARGRNYLGVQRTSTKQFPQFHWTGQQWQKGLPKGFLKIPYRLPELLDAPPDAWVVIAAGEKDAETAAALGFVATTNSGGEGKGQWTPELGHWFVGKQHVAIMEDNDDAGHAHAPEVATALRGIVPDIRIVRFRELKTHGDLTDWINAVPGRGHAELLARIEAAAPAEPELDEWDAGEVLGGALPEPRQWLTAGQFCRTFLSGLVAPGDVGKTTLRLTQAIELATGRELVGLRVFQRCRALVLSFEDDRAELHRRLMAICKHHGIDPSELKGWLFCRDLNVGPKLAELDSKGRRRQVGALEGMLRRAIARTRCDLLILDPFVKLHGLNESDNPDMDFVCSLLIKIAQDCNIAVDSPAHTHKGVITAGDADARRGASAQRDAGRLDYTFTVMSEDEAEQFGIAADVRKSYMRLDKAKANIVRAVKARWFRLVSVPLNNATALYPEGDDVQALERWEPPETWADVSTDALNAILNATETEMPAGRRYSGKPQAKDRAAWLMVQKHCPTKTEAQCREMVREWIKAGVLFEAKYHDPVSRKEEWGLFVDRNKRPQY